jgi:hypothetical protein
MLAVVEEPLKLPPSPEIQYPTLPPAPPVKASATV